MSSTQIKLWKDDGWWVATDIPTGVTSQGETREDALANLDEAVELYEDDTGRAPRDAELREIGIEPADDDGGTDETGLFE